MSINSEEVIDSALGNKEVKKELNDLKKKTTDSGKNVHKKSFLENPKAMRNARSISVGLVILLLPLIYFLTKDNLDLSLLFSVEMGLLILYTSIGSFLNVWETRKRAFEDTVDEEKEISENEIKITENGQKLSNHTVQAMPILNNYNDKLQESYDLQKTGKKIRKLKIKVARLSIAKNNAETKYFGKFMRILLFPKLLNNLVINHKTAKLNRKEAKIKRLKAINIRDNKFKPYRIERLLTTRSSNRYTYIGDSKIRSAPDKVDAKKTLLKMPLKSIGYSLGGGVIPLIMGESIWTVFVFYLGYATGQVITSLTQYLLTVYKTKNEFKTAQVEKIRLQEMLLAEVNKPKEIEKNVEELKSEKSKEPEPEIKSEPKISLNHVALTPKGLESSIRIDDKGLVPEIEEYKRKPLVVKKSILNGKIIVPEKDI